jgi:hypothetical protein
VISGSLAIDQASLAEWHQVLARLYRLDGYASDPTAMKISFRPRFSQHTYCVGSSRNQEFAFMLYIIKNLKSHDLPSLGLG